MELQMPKGWHFIKKNAPLHKILNIELIGATLSLNLW